MAVQIPALHTGITSSREGRNCYLLWISLLAKESSHRSFAAGYRLRSISWNPATSWCRHGLLAKVGVFHDWFKGIRMPSPCLGATLLWSTWPSRGRLITEKNQIFVWTAEWREEWVLSPYPRSLLKQHTSQPTISAALLTKRPSFLREPLKQEPPGNSEEPLKNSHHVISIPCHKLTSCIHICLCPLHDWLKNCPN